jgi:peptide/nickel transport system ATP-binding protein
MDDQAILQVRGLSTHFPSRTGLLKAVDDVSFCLRRGRTLCVVGESGSGKSVTARSIMQIVPKPGKIVSGSIILERDTPAGPTKIDIASLDPKGPEIRSIRGADIGMIFQEPMSSLSPVHTIGFQIVESIRIHTKATKAEAKARAIEVLHQVKIRSPEQSFDCYPFEFSGGMRQRAMIAMALACRPKILIADEPTTALDVTTQAEILELIQSLQKAYGMAVMFITHDMGVVAEIADEVAVMTGGKLVETGNVDQVFYEPKHPYTRSLLGAVKKLESRGHRSITAEQGVGKKQSPLLTINKLCMDFPVRRGILQRVVGTISAVKDVSLVLNRGETLGIVGESGSGKTTLGRCLVRMFKATQGEVIFNGEAGRRIDVVSASKPEMEYIRRNIRMIFQDPYSSLNPRMTVKQIVAEPLVVSGGFTGSEVEDRVGSLLVKVGLSRAHMNRYPHAFSGGQRQRIGIARALALEPKIIIADEPTSALDVSLRAQILDLLRQVQDAFGLSIIFVSHDISVIRYMCDRVAVMHKGKVVEIGGTDDVCESPKDEYTKSLISAVLVPDPRKRRMAGRQKFDSLKLN